LPAGEYSGGVVIDKPLTLSGDGQVWIDAACASNFGIEVSADGVTIEGVGIRNARESNVAIDEVTGVTLDRLTLEDWNCANAESQANAGVACWYCSGMTIRDSTMTTSRPFGNGIWVKSTSEKPAAGGHTITGNRISGGFDGIGDEAEDDPMGGFVRDTVISDNQISNCRDDGIQVEGRDENVTVRRNTVRGCGIGIAMAPNLVGPLLIEENLLEDMVPGYYDQQACFKVGDGGDGVAELRDNVCRTTGEGLKQTNAGLSTMNLSGNCFIVTGYAYYLTDDPEGVFRDNWIESTNDLLIRWGGQIFENVQQFRQASGQESGAAMKDICERLS
jgi:parallel beta-helix repeat protein